jgi:hypothetical protein
MKQPLLEEMSKAKAVRGTEIKVLPRAFSVEYVELKKNRQRGTHSEPAKRVEQEVAPKSFSLSV